MEKIDLKIHDALMEIAKEKEIFYITVEVRNENHQRINFSKNVKINDLKFELEVEGEKKYLILEVRIKELHKILKQINPKLIFNIDASVFNFISKTYMSMAGFYGLENKFVKFT